MQPPMPPSDAKSPDTFPNKLLLPHYWPAWLLIGLAWALVQLPFRCIIATGGALGLAFMRASARRRRIGETNLRLCFPDMAAEERGRMLRENFRSLGIAVLEKGMAWWWSSHRLGRLIVQTEGLHHLEQAHLAGKGVILLSAHFTTAEIGVRLLNVLYPIIPMYREHENPIIRAMMHRRFKAYFKAVIPRDDVRAMIRCLRRGDAVWYAPDQNYGRRGHVFAPFFGVPAATNPATGRFARMGDAVVIPYFAQRLRGGRGYRLRLLAPLDDFPTGDERSDAARVNGLLEAEVRDNAEQYLWVHRRFKTRPPGEKSVYE
jgi:KDO2-lipid IV(A) lauroyltransferase